MCSCSCIMHPCIVSSCLFHMFLISLVLSSSPPRWYWQMTSSVMSLSLILRRLMLQMRLPSRSSHLMLMFFVGSRSQSSRCQHLILDCFPVVLRHLFPSWVGSSQSYYFLSLYRVMGTYDDSYSLFHFSSGCALWLMDCETLFSI